MRATFLPRFAFVLATGRAEEMDVPSGPVGPEPPSGVIAITIDRDRYGAVMINPPPTARYQFTIVAEIRNNSGRTVFLNRCRAAGPTPLFEVAVVGLYGAEAGYGPAEEALGCVGAFPIGVLPGQSRTDQLTVTGPNSFQGSPGGGPLEPIGIVEGRFRILYRVYPCSGIPLCEPGGPELWWSNAFEVVTVE